MKPDRFLENELGWWSSHPFFQERKRRRLQLLALVPLGAVLVLAAWLALDYENWAGMLSQAPRWLLVVSACLTFALAALVTLAMNARWAELQLSGKVQAHGLTDGRFTEQWVLRVGILLGIVGPLIAVTVPGLPSQVRFAFHLAPILPFFGLLFGMGSLGKDDGQEKQRRPIWMVLLLIFLSVGAMTLLHDILQALDRVGFLAHWLPAWYRPFSGAIVLIPLAYVLLMLWRLWPARVKVQAASSARVRKKPGLFGLLWKAIQRLFVPAPRIEAPQEDRWPKWLDELLEKLPDGCRSSHEPRRFEKAESASVSSATELKALFGGVVPTVDQLEVFQRFRDSYQEGIQEGWGWQTSNATQPSAAQPSSDLLVHGEPGCGRTTTLIACAIYAALGRGQRVLLLVPNQQRLRFVKQRIDAALEETGVGQYVTSGIVGEQEVKAWLAVEDEKQPVVPQILLATLDAAEESLYGLPHLDKDRFERLRRLVLLLEVVLVDDFMEFADAERSHLPFLLDKQRLLLEADCTPLQVVVTCPTLATIARTTFGSRLFTETRLQSSRNVLTLRPRECGTAWRVDLEADEIGQAVDQMVVACIQRGLDVVLYRRGADEGTLRRQEDDLASQSGGEKRVSVISDLDQPLHVPPEQVDAVFYQVAAQQDVCLALRMHMGNGDSVIFCLRPTGDICDRPVTGIVPVVADRSASPLMVAHLRGVVRFFRQGTPVLESTWSQFGLACADLDVVDRRIESESHFRHDRWEEDERGRGPIFPYVVSPRDTHVAAQVVDTHILPTETHVVCKLDQRPYFHIGRIDDDGQRGKSLARRRAAWHSSSTQQPLGRQIDLAHVREFRLVTGTEAFAPRAEIEDAKGEYRLKAWPWQGRGEDPYLPVYSLEWELEDPVAQPMGGGPDYGIQWFGVEPADRQPVLVKAAIERLMTEYGNETPINAMKFEYPARLTGLLLRPERLDSDDNTAIGRVMAGYWGTGGSWTWSAVLTGAVNYALQARLPGFSYFARALAFWLGEENDDEDAVQIASAVVWFVEPTSGGRTAVPILSELFRNSDERANLLDSVLWFLEQLETMEEVDRKARFLRRFSGVSDHGDESFGQVDDAFALMRDIVDHNEKNNAAGGGTRRHGRAARQAGAQSP